MKRKFPSVSERLSVWEEIYSRHGLRWNVFPSLAANMALRWISRIDKKTASLLDCGCGYGRDLHLFGEMFPRIELIGIDASKKARHLIKKLNPPLRSRDFVSKNIFECEDYLSARRFDVIFSNYFFHLFSKEECQKILDLLRSSLDCQGLLISSFVSSRDRHFGRGIKYNPNCYEVRRGQPWLFMTEDDVKSVCHSTGFSILELQDYEEVESVDGQPDPVRGLFLVARVR